MNKWGVLFFLLPLMSFCQDMPYNKDVALRQISDLKEGALIVRLKTNDKSVAAYRNNGKPEIADRIEEERARQNLKIISAFRNYFDFSRVYFIYASSTNDFLKGKRDVFLNDSLQPDKKIKLKEDYYLFAEYGVLIANMQQDGSRGSGTRWTEESANPSSNSALFITDTTLAQLQEPFPFAQVVLLENYHKAVDRLNSALHRFYFNRITRAVYKQPKKPD